MPGRLSEAFVARHVFSLSTGPASKPWPQSPRDDDRRQLPRHRSDARGLACRPAKPDELRKSGPVHAQASPPYVQCPPSGAARHRRPTIVRGTQRTLSMSRVVANPERASGDDRAGDSLDRLKIVRIDQLRGTRAASAHRPESGRMARLLGWLMSVMPAAMSFCSRWSARNRAGSELPLAGLESLVARAERQAVWLPHRRHADDRRSAH